VAAVKAPIIALGETVPTEQRVACAPEVCAYVRYFVFSVQQARVLLRIWRVVKHRYKGLN
jgi:hypothetical protein